MNESTEFLRLSPEELGTPPKQCDVFKQLASELKTVKESIPFLEDIIARGGFVLDTIMAVEPNDLDIFYSLKEWQTPEWPGCKCEELKKGIAFLNLPITSSRKVDVCHILEGEIYLDPIPKCLGYFSHHIEIPSKVLLDSDGYIWTTKEAATCIKERIYELRNTGRVQHAYYPYMEDPGYRNYITTSARIVARGLRMIHTKKYKSVGKEFFELVENSSLIWQSVLNNQEYTKMLKRNMIVKNGFMKLDDYKNALDVVGSTKKEEILSSIQKILEN